MAFFSKRRNQIVEGYLLSMHARGVYDAQIPALYFDAAVRYAQDHGGVLYHDMPDSIIFDETIHGEAYSVFIMKGRGGRGTSITPSPDDSSVKEMIEKAIPFFRRPSWAGNPDKLNNFIDAVIEVCRRGQVPAIFLRPFATDDDYRDEVLEVAGGLEAMGCTFEEQKRVSGKFMQFAYERLSPENKVKVQAYDSAGI